MHWIALKDGQRITAETAVKNTQYLCPECLCIVHMRSGPHRRPHYYHVSKNSLCRQQGKTAFHLETQLAIQKAAPEAILEFSFPSISRIADVFWPSKKIVFEVQCSSISYEEIRKRTEDYNSLGLQIVWILHDRRYNRRKLSSAELFLNEGNYYFSSIDTKGLGIIYDQFALVKGAKRIFKGAKLPVAISWPYAMCEIACTQQWPKEAIARKESREIGFQGDLVDRIHKSAPTAWKAMKSLEHSKKESLLKRSQKAWVLIKGIYSSFLHALLEKHSI